MSPTVISPTDFAFDVLVETLQHRLAGVAPILSEAREALGADNRDGAVGALVPLRSCLSEARTLLDAALLLYDVQ